MQYTQSQSQLQGEAAGAGTLSGPRLGMLPPDITRRLHRLSPDIAAYLSSSIQASIAAMPAHPTALQTLGALDQAAECLGGSLLMPELLVDAEPGSSATLLPVCR